MDKESVVERLCEVFHAERENGLEVDQFNLTCAYRGLDRDKYILNVSAPSLVDNSDRIGVIIEFLWRILSCEEKAFINRVRVFDNKNELKKALFRELEEAGYIFADSEMMPKLHEVA